LNALAHVWLVSPIETHSTSAAAMPPKTIAKQHRTIRRTPLSVGEDGRGFVAAAQSASSRRLGARKL
jgi:hypothetical protein